ncbi:LysM peptidoglycan-binding domain-containing protein, partial [Paenibacillus forsythiae]
MKIHIVKQGDTLYELSKKYGVPLDKVIEANPQIANPDVLAIGDKVKIPSVPVPVPDGGELYHKHTVKQGDTLWKLSKAWGIQLKDIIGANPQLKNPDVLKIGDIVNIPKKATVPSAHPAQPVQPAQPIQQEHATTSVSDKTTPGGKAYTGPIEKAKETAPVVPAPAPVPEPAPIPAPAPPVQETVHTETQSLFVQISVPAQEAAPLPPAPEPPKEYCIPEPPKNYCGCEP